MVRHREPRAAARGRQPAATRRRTAAEEHLLPAVAGREVTHPAQSRFPVSAVAPLPSGAWLLELVLPQRCVFCAGSAPLLCAACNRSLRRLRPPFCSRCGAPTAWPVERCRECSGRRLGFTTARAAVAYAGAARALVAAWKEHGLRRVGPLAAELVADVVEPPAADVITYIPADPDRLLRRGHHPAERLARALGARWGIGVAPLLVRDGSRRRQAELSRAERLRNAREAFVAVAAPAPAVLLVDDVYTTGATAAAGATALRRAGARRVDVVTFARTVRS